ncbi:hypothetical protein CHR53_07175 [Neobacillus mesonae]|uniref:Uncharacterized protein n=1 Tax=Neobacillus mesonae TaxID=1193713 RepID=A0A3T0HVA4_9BACI|nr:hypothetical protein CHR53_07175 [Neobacillus mesonae]
MTRCGVCNHDLNMGHVLYHKLEDDGTITSYHIACGGKTKDIEPCEDCGQHRLLCDECKES